MEIDGTPIDPDELSAEYRRLMQSQIDRPDDLKATAEEVTVLATENVINKHLIVREARNRFPGIKPEEIRRRAVELKKQMGDAFNPAAHEADMEDDVRVQKLLRQLHADVPHITDAEAKEEYDKDPSRYQEPERVHVSHIVRHTFGGADPGTALQQILEAQRRLKAGVPFAEVSRHFSDQFGQAGDLGTFPRGSMVDKFERVAFRMKAGEISDVFQTEFGYHIAFLHEKHPARERSFEEARKDVVAELSRAREAEAFDTMVSTLRSNSVISRDQVESDSAPPADE